VRAIEQPLAGAGKAEEIEDVRRWPTRRPAQGMGDFMQRLDHHLVLRKAGGEADLAVVGGRIVRVEEAEQLQLRRVHRHQRRALSELGMGQGGGEIRPGAVDETVAIVRLEPVGKEIVGRAPKEAAADGPEDTADERSQLRREDGARHGADEFADLLGGDRLIADKYAIVRAAIRYRPRPPVIDPDVDGDLILGSLRQQLPRGLGVGAKPVRGGVRRRVEFEVKRHPARSGYEAVTHRTLPELFIHSPAIFSRDTKLYTSTSKRRHRQRAKSSFVTELWRSAMTASDF